MPVQITYRSHVRGVKTYLNSFHRQNLTRPTLERRRPTKTATTGSMFADSQYGGWPTKTWGKEIVVFYIKQQQKVKPRSRNSDWELFGTPHHGSLRRRHLCHTPPFVVAWFVVVSNTRVIMFRRCARCRRRSKKPEEMSRTKKNPNIFPPHPTQWPRSRSVHVFGRNRLIEINTLT